MRTEYLSVVVVTVLLFAHAPYCSPQSSSGLQTWLEDTGSVPAVGQWFSCIRELNHKPYDKQKAQECLDSILSHPEIEQGHIVFDEQREFLTFSIKSPTLILSDMDLDIAAMDLAKFHTLLPENGLRIGEPYDPHRESRIWFALDLLLRSQGRRTGVSRTLQLDYAKKTPQVAYKIWEGPPVEPEVLPPPYSPQCSVTNLNFNYLDVDDFTPMDMRDASTPSSFSFPIW